MWVSIYGTMHRYIYDVPCHECEMSGMKLWLCVKAPFFLSYNKNLIVSLEKKIWSILKILKGTGKWNAMTYEKINRS